MVVGIHVDGEQAIAIFKVVAKDDTAHTSQRRVANESRAQAAFTSKNFSCEGNALAIRDQWNCHLAQSPVRHARNSTDWRSLVLLDLHLVCKAVGLHAVVEKLPEGFRPYKSGGSSRIHNQSLSLLATNHKVLVGVVEARDKGESSGMLLVLLLLLVVLRQLITGRARSGALHTSKLDDLLVL